MFMLYVVEIDEDDQTDASSSWEGNVNSMKRHIEKMNDQSSKKMSKKIDLLYERVVENEVRDDAKEREMKSQMERLLQVYSKLESFTEEVRQER